ncbi:glutathione S-transferase Mu 1-like [Oppia nitens]|uniref:glutathione S-transferase Mu 1-like n=1 Tax=Oppia nitens TaxID=1686743 RepID=UPI0023DA37EF|nr:glutathione S-transferase Mu 1-like [Oppia nitens]
MSSSKPTLGYYKVRGLAQPIRLLLKYAGVDFTDKYYEFGSADSIESMRVNWLKDKYQLGLDFPNVPYYLDGQHHIKLTQSTAILRYLARKHGLIGTSECALARQDMAEYQLADIRNGFIQTLRNNDFDKSRQTYANDQLSKQLDELSTFLGQQHDWLAGKQLTYVDFLAYELLDWFRLFSPETFQKFPVLIKYLNRFESLPAIKAYMSSSEFISWPVSGPISPWGYKK